MSTEINGPSNETPPRRAALVAGIGLVILVISVVSAEYLFLPKLLVPGNATDTAQTIDANRPLFLAMFFLYLISFIGDLVVAWALYVFLKPVNKSISLLAGWCRLVYAVIVVAALLNLLTTWHLLSGADYLDAFGTDQLHAQILHSVNTFRYEWDLAFPFFSLHLGLLAYLIVRSNYVPSFLGILLALEGGGLVVEYVLKPFFFPSFDTDLLMVTFFGELVLMVWLLIWGSRIREPARSGQVT